MKKYDILEIAIRILGLSMVPTIFYWLSSLILMLPFGSSGGIGFGNNTAITFFISLGSDILFSIPIFVFIFNPGFVIRLITRGKEQDTPFDLTAERDGFIEIALIIIGGISFVKTVPSLFFDIYGFVTWKKFSHDDKGRFPTNELWTHLVTVCLAVIVIVYAKPLGRFFAKRSQNGTKELDRTD